MSMNVCVYEDLHGKKWLYTYGAILNKDVLLLLLYTNVWMCYVC